MRVTEVEDMVLLRIFCKEHATQDLKTANLTSEIIRSLGNHCESFCHRSLHQKLFAPRELLGKRVIGIVGDRVRPLV